MDENEATRLCREVWRQLVTSQDRIRRVQGKLREAQGKKLRVPAKGDIAEESRIWAWEKTRKELAGGEEDRRKKEEKFVKREEAEVAKNKIMSAISVRGIQDVKILFKHMRFVTEAELMNVVRSKLRLSETAVSETEISNLFQFVDQKGKKKIPVTSVCAFLVPEYEGIGDEQRMDPLEALRWKRMELARDLERCKENIA
jgi:hypothetical protein